MKIKKSKSSNSNGFREVVLTDDINVFLYGNPKEIVGLMKQRLSAVGDCHTRLYTANSENKFMHKYLDKLREAGLDIDRENSEFGFRMPVPDVFDIYRKLIIFRRDDFD